ncbi:thrombopoietin receptor [Embiotoca jacksoni]|uniref:thrombopoietin receptor n=1 Tax=Embiotoca jacksoni TaxID=100190 RepID=UPI003704AC48
MNLLCRLEMLFFSLWIQVGFVPGIRCNNTMVNHLSREVVLLLEDGPNPKCLTRTEQDFTCFFETANDSRYDLFYTSGSQPTKRCEMSVQRTEEETFLHVCSFPDSDVWLFVEIRLEAVECATNTSLYVRNVSVEDHLLLDPPFNVSLYPNGQVGQLQVSWQTALLKYLEDDVIYRIQYSSSVLGEKTKEVKQGGTLDSLVPGEEVNVSLKCFTKSGRGHWSSWSHPARATVPQSADDISLICFTPDLNNVTCRWNGSRYGAENDYKPFYKTHLGERLGWTEWTECPAVGNFTDLCGFRGNEFRKVRIKLSSSPDPISRTFYTEEFTLRHFVKTSPPAHLRGALNKDKLCLKWEAPLPSLSNDLQYEVDFQIRGGAGWRMIKSPGTDACIEVVAGSRYSIKVRAKPTGSIYSGYWSNWSDVLTGDIPTDIGMLLILCIPASMLVATIILFFLFSKFLSRLKQYFWPPVPNLDKVLQGFLTEINKQKWDPPVTAKQYSEESTSSVVEIMCEGDGLGSGKPSEESTELQSPEGSYSSGEQVDGSPGTELFPDYVTLNKGSVVCCPAGNAYVYERVREKRNPEVEDDLLQTCHCSRTDGSVGVPPCSGTDFLNQSYLPVAEHADRFNCKATAARGPGNLYTNFPSS